MNTNETQKPKRKIWPWFLGCLGIFIFCGSLLLNIFLIFALFLKFGEKGSLMKGETKLQETIIKGPEREGEKIAEIIVEGPIFYQENQLTSLSSNQTSANFILKQIRQAKSDSNVKAIVLSIKSPGGSISACDEIYQEIISAHTAGKKVVAYLNETATSGGYYIALAADKIIATPTTLTGSIGVITQTFNFKELLEKYGIKSETIKSGKYKDILSSFREITPEEREILQTIINEYQQQFLDLVKKHRPGLDSAKIEKISDGRVFSAKQAYELKLIDELGYEDQAIDLAAKLANIKEKTVIRYKPPFRWESLFGSISSNFPQEKLIKNLLEEANFNQRKILLR